MENNRKMKDFLSSIVLLALSFFVLFESWRIYQKAGKLLYLSPALIPLMLGGILLLLSLVLLLESLKDGGAGARVEEMKAVFRDLKKDPNSFRMLVGVYTFVLLGLLPFWLATFLFMLLLMYFLEAGSLVQIVSVSVLVTALIIFLFQVCFRVPLP